MLLKRRTRFVVSFSVGDVMPRSPPFLKGNRERIKITLLSRPLFQHVVLEIHNVLKAKQKIYAIFGNSVFIGKWVVLCEFHLETRAEERAWAFHTSNVISPLLPQ